MGRSTERISVYITSYNQEVYLAEAIESILNQTLRPFEIIIVDGGSTDLSRRTIATYASRYPELITPIYHPQNRGIAQARVDAMHAASGDYVSHVDGDDRFLPTKLEKEAGLLMDNPDADIAFSNYHYMTAEGIHTGLWVEGKAPPQGDVFQQVFARDFPKGNLFRNELVDYQSWKRIGFYDLNLSLYEDYEMLIRLTKNLRAVYLDEPLAEYRKHDAGLSNIGAAQQLAAFEYIFEKDKHLLRGLSLAERKRVVRGVNRFMAGTARQAAQQAIEDNQQGSRHALGYFIRCLQYERLHASDFRLILGILLPGLWNRNRERPLLGG